MFGRMSCFVWYLVSRNVSFWCPVSGGMCCFGVQCLEVCVVLVFSVWINVLFWCPALGRTLVLSPVLVARLNYNKDYKYTCMYNLWLKPEEFSAISFLFEYLYQPFNSPHPSQWIRLKSAEMDFQTNVKSSPERRDGRAGWHLIFHRVLARLILTFTFRRPPSGKLCAEGLIHSVDNWLDRWLLRRAGDGI